jgi:hypothetical protein
MYVLIDRYVSIPQCDSARACACVCVRAHVCARVHVHVRVGGRVCGCMRVYMRVCVHVLPVYECKHACVCVKIRACERIHTHTYSCIIAPLRGCFDINQNYIVFPFRRRN